MMLEFYRLQKSSKLSVSLVLLFLLAMLFICHKKLQRLNSKASNISTQVNTKNQPTNGTLRQGIIIKMKKIFIQVDIAITFFLLHEVKKNAKVVYLQKRTKLFERGCLLLSPSRIEKKMNL